MNGHFQLGIFIAVCALTVSAQAFETPRYKPHPETGEKLIANPDNPSQLDTVFCDLNQNGAIDLDEMKMTEENICVVLTADGAIDRTDDNTLFAKNPITAGALGLRKGELVLTIDDGPNPDVTLPLLDLLDEYNIKATFFMVGRQVDAYPKVVQEVKRRGHTIANHTWSHDVKNITPTTITSEVLKADDSIFRALGFREPRLLFRAPGLAWTPTKAVNLNQNGRARKYIGPIHANLGTDAPRADWDCWGKGVSAITCADWYFRDIVNAGRGVILSHDIYFKRNRPNSYEMWKIILPRLNNEAGGITNKNSGRGLWTFVNLAENQNLDQFEDGAVPAPSEPTSPVVTHFRNLRVNVRTHALESATELTDATKIVIPGGFLTTANLAQVTLDGTQKIIGASTFRRARIDKTIPGFEQFVGKIVYIWTEAF